MRIQNNITAMNTHRQYTINNDNVAKAAEKLSSGYRINRAADDAAGLAISEKMRSQIRGLNMATKNSQDAISLVQTAEGALQETHSMLQRMNELAVQAATGTNQDFDKIQAAKEFEQLKREINDVAESTTFNNMKILDGSLSYKGYERSAATAGVTVTKPTSESSSAAPSTTPGATITAASGIDMTETPGAAGNISFEVTYTKEDGTEATTTLTAAVDTSGDLQTQAGANGIALTGSDGWSGVLKSDGSLTITNTNETFKEGEGATIAVDVDNATTSLTAVTTDATGTVATAQAAADAEAAAVANGKAGKGEFTVTSWTSATGGAGGSATELTFTDADGNVGTITGGTVAAATAWAATDLPADGIIEMKDANGDTVYSLQLTFDKTAGKITAQEAADADGKVTGADLTGMTVGLGVVAAGNALGGTAPTAQTIAGIGGDAATLKGTAPVAQDDNAGSTKTPDVTTIEFGFDKMREGDKITISVGGSDIEVTKDAGETRQSFIKKLEDAVAANNYADGTVKVSGTAIVVQEGVEVGEPKLDSSNSTDKEKTTAMRIQVGALENEQLNIAIDSMNTAGLGLDGMNLETQDAAGAAITAVRAAVNKVSDQRATLGAMQNRLDHKIANLKVSSENLSAAESRIRDVDMASEMTNFTKNNILSQAATAMLAQANALPQNVLSLLG